MTKASTDVNMSKIGGARGVFVTGTDTGVGKTLFSCALAAALVRRGWRVAVMKPVETGCTVQPTSEDDAALARLAAIAGPPPIAATQHAQPQQLTPHDALLLQKHAQRPDQVDTVPLDLINPYRFAPPIAPAAAARAANRSIDLAHILTCYQRLIAEADFIIVEGAGGLMVPMTDHHTYVDLAQKLSLPVVIVARTTLGTINHTLLTIAALKNNHIPLSGVVFNRLQLAVAIEETTNPILIEQMAGDVILGTLPYLTEAQRGDADILAQRLHVHIDIDRITMTQ